MRSFVILVMALALSLSGSAFGFQVYGEIGSKWQQLGAATGPLGEPVTDELDAPYGGRFNQFKYGFIFWHPETGAHAVWGLIGEKWNELGRAKFGYPITDELSTPDGRGRFNHFRAIHLPGKPEASIYWSPETGVHEIYGAIRDKWAQTGWEKGFLGYPTSSQFQEGSNWRVNFQKGYIIWSQNHRAEAFPNARILETMTDRCSGDVFISALYADSFDPHSSNGILLQRGSPRSNNWSGHLKVNGHTHIRWFCRSAAGNWADPGTWRINNGTAYVSASGHFEETTGAITVEEVKPELSGSVLSSAVGGWTPERSRCDSSDTRSIDARLGPDRLLQIRCWDR